MTDVPNEDGIILDPSDLTRRVFTNRELLRAIRHAIERFPDTPELPEDVEHDDLRALRSLEDQIKSRIWLAELPSSLDNMSNFLDTISYTIDQQRAAKYIVDISGIGGGTDPVGFLISSHAHLREQINDNTVTIDALRRTNIHTTNERDVLRTELTEARAALAKSRDLAMKVMADQDNLIAQIEELHATINDEDPGPR